MICAFIVLTIGYLILAFLYCKGIDKAHQVYIVGDSSKPWDVYVCYTKKQAYKVFKDIACVDVIREEYYVRKHDDELRLEYTISYPNEKSKKYTVYCVKEYIYQ